MTNVEYIPRVMNMSARNRLREIRHEMLIDKQIEMANLLGIAQNQYNRYEKGGQPTLEVALKIAKRLNRPVEDIFFLDEDDPQ